MLSPSYGRQAPPVIPSKSLEGLEKVIPPASPLSLAGRPYYLQLDKPLPDKPLPETPEMSMSMSMGYYSTAAWSHDSSTVGSSTRCSSRESSRYSTDSYPIFVSSGSDDGAGTGTGSGTDGKIGDRHLPPSVPDDGSGKDDRLLGSSSIDATKIEHDSPDRLEGFLANDDDDDDDDGNSPNDDEQEDHEERYGPEIRHTVADWTQNRYGPNHYFREKKWDFFPELATPGALPGGKFPSGRPASALQTNKESRRRNLSAFDFGRLNRGRANTVDRAGSGLALAQNVRDSIKSAVQWTFPRLSLEKEKERQRQQSRPSTARSEKFGYGGSQRAATAASERTGTSTTYTGSAGSISKPSPNYEDIFSASDRLRKTLSLSTRSSILGTNTSPCSAPLPQRPKPLAIPLSPYQRYGAAIWEKRRSTRHRVVSHNVRFPRYYQNRRWSSSLLSSTSISTSTDSNRLTMTQSNPVLPVSPPLRSQLQRIPREYIRALQDGTSYMLDALNGAKRRVIDSRADRRRAQLKARIRLVGPVNPYTAGYGRDAWV